MERVHFQYYPNGNAEKERERESFFFFFYLIFMNKRERDFPTVIWNTLISS